MKRKIQRTAVLMLFLFSTQLFPNDLNKNNLLKNHGIVYNGHHIIPLAAIIPNIYFKDIEGFGQLLLTELVAGITTNTLKHSVQEPRPRDRMRNRHKGLSFPSGHASISFAASSFIQFRYGIKYSIPFYLASGLVAYQRVHVKAHYTHDVIAGGLLGFLSGYLSTTSFNKTNTRIIYNGKMAGIIWRYFFD